MADNEENTSTEATLQDLITSNTGALNAMQLSNTDLRSTLRDSLKEQKELNRNVNRLLAHISQNEQLIEEVSSIDSTDSNLTASTVKALSSDTEAWPVYEPKTLDLLHRKQRTEIEQKTKIIEQLETKNFRLEEELSQCRADFYSKLIRETQKNDSLKREIDRLRSDKDKLRHELTRMMTNFDGESVTSGQNHLSQSRSRTLGRSNTRQPRTAERRSRSTTRPMSVAFDREFSFDDLRNNFG